nr:zinc knuckle CX2CX4HX4C [Tanacetum cinerariifolium]
MIELRANIELKDTIVVAMTKLVGEGFYMCTIRVKYEWKPPRCSSCKVSGHVLDECPKNIVSGVKKNLKNPRQAARGVQIITSTTSITERIDKLERQIIDEKLTLVDDNGEPLPKVVSTQDVDSDSEVEDVVDGHA